MLRRVKADVKLNLPPKKELVVYAPMSSIQLDLYKAVLDYNFVKLRNLEEVSVYTIDCFTNFTLTLTVYLLQENEFIIDGVRQKRTCTQSKKYYVLEDLFKDEDALMESSGFGTDKLVFV